MFLDVFVKGLNKDCVNGVSKLLKCVLVHFFSDELIINSDECFSLATCPKDEWLPKFASNTAYMDAIGKVVDHSNAPFLLD